MRKTDNNNGFQVQMACFDMSEVLKGIDKVQNEWIVVSSMGVSK